MFRIRMMSGRGIRKRGSVRCGFVKSSVFSSEWKVWEKFAKWVLLVSCSGTGQVAVVALAGLLLEGGTTSAANKAMLNTM